MARFTAEEKIQIVKHYLNGYVSYYDLQKTYHVSESVIRGWVKLYEDQGANAFFKPYTKHSQQFKLDVLQYMNETGASSYEAAAIFNILSPSLVRRWRKLVERDGVDALKPKKKGRLAMKKETKSNVKKQLPVEGSIEALQAENERLRMENTYLKKLNSLVQAQEKLQTKSKRK